MVTLCMSASAQAALIGAQAVLNTNYHNVGGTVTVVDEDTFRVDNFTYDGGGPAVYFYLGTGKFGDPFTPQLEVLPILTGTQFDGTQGTLFFDLPAGENFTGYHAISVWCAAFGVDFGSGVFDPPEGDLSGDGFVGIDDLGIVLGNWNNTVTPGDNLHGDPSGDGFVGITDLNIVLGAWNIGSSPAFAVPEPAAGLVLPIVLLWSRRRCV